MANTENASALDVRRDRAGKAWLSVDSLVDLFDQMAEGMKGGPVESSFRNLADSFRPMSSYDQLLVETQYDDGSTMRARRCDCGTVVVDGKSIGGEALVVEAEPVTDGGLFPLRVRGGVPTLAPYGEHLDGIGTIRLREHACAGHAS